MARPLTSVPNQRSPYNNISTYHVGRYPKHHIPRSVVFRHSHVQSTATVSQVLGGQHRALLADEQRSAVGVAADVVGADGQIGNLQALDAVDVEALVEHTVLDDAVALLRGHGARAQGVPGGLDVALGDMLVGDSGNGGSGWLKTHLGPLDDMFDVLLAVWQVLTNGLLVAVKHAWLRRLAGLDWHRPRAVLNTSSDVVRAGVGICRGKVHVQGASWAVIGIEWVHACDLASVRIHAPCRLTRLDVSPDCTKSAWLTCHHRPRRLTHGCHVSLIVHEASIEVRRVVARRAGDESASTAERILEEVEHGEKLYLVSNDPK